MRWLAIVACAAAAGCSLLTPLGDFASEDPAPAADASAPSDAGPPSADVTVEALDASADADADQGATLPNLHFNGTFETGCTGWGSYAATLTPSNVAHGGTGSCLVCADDTAADFTIDDNGALQSPPIGSEYRVEAWIRTAPARPVPGTAGIMLRTRNDNPFAEIETSSTNGPPLTEAWTRVVTTLAVTKTAQSLNVVVGARTVKNACFLVDDVVLTRVK